MIFGGVAAGEALDLGTGENRGVDPHPALGTAEGQAHDQRRLPRHEHGQGGDLAEIDVGGVADAALGRPHGEHVLHAVGEHGFHVVVALAAEGERGDERPLRNPEPGMDVVVEAHDSGNPV